MHEQACSSCVSPAISFAVDARPYPHFNDNTAIIETDTIPQSTLLSIDPNPPTTVCLPLSRSHTPDPVSDDRTAMDHVPLSRCSTGPEPEVESFTDVLVTNGKYDPATRHTTSTCTREWGYLDRSQLWLSLYLFGRRRRNHGSVSGHFFGPSHRMFLLILGFYLVHQQSSYVRYISLPFYCVCNIKQHT
jgi:hypothetical protein